MQDNGIAVSHLNRPQLSLVFPLELSQLDFKLGLGVSQLQGTREGWRSGTGIAVIQDGRHPSWQRRPKHRLSDKGGVTQMRVVDHHADKGIFSGQDSSRLTVSIKTSLFDSRWCSTSSLPRKSPSCDTAASACPDTALSSLSRVATLCHR
jgi:hypothetical protein